MATGFETLNPHPGGIGTLPGTPGNPPRVPWQYRQVQGDTAIRGEVQALLERGETARQIVVHLTDHGQYPEREIMTMLGSIQTALPRPNLFPSQAILLPMHSLLDNASIRYVTNLLSSTKYNAAVGSVTTLFAEYNYPPAANAVVAAQVAVLQHPPDFGPHDPWSVGDVISLSERLTSGLLLGHSPERYTEGVIMDKSNTDGLSYTIATAPHNDWSEIHVIQTRGPPQSYGAVIFHNAYLIAAKLALQGGTTHPAPGIPYGTEGHTYTRVAQNKLDAQVARLISPGLTPEEVAVEETRVRARYRERNIDPAQVAVAITAARTPAEALPGRPHREVVTTTDLTGANEDPHTFSMTPGMQVAGYGRPGHVYFTRGTVAEILRVTAALVAVPHTDAEVRHLMYSMNLGPPSVVTEALRRARMAAPGSGITVQAAAPPPVVAVQVGSVAPATGAHSGSATVTGTQATPATATPTATPTSDEGQTCPTGTRRRLPAMGGVSRPREPSGGGMFDDPGAQTCTTFAELELEHGERPGFEGSGGPPTKRARTTPESSASASGGSGAILIAGALAVGVLVAKFS